MIQQEKTQLRKQSKILFQEQHLSLVALKELLHKIQKLPVWSQSHTVLLYAPLTDEPDLRSLLEKSSHRFFFSRMHGDSLEIYEWFSAAPWIIGPYGVREPDPKIWRLASISEIDLALIPGIAFDPQCYRLGRGAGYFDRLLGDSSCHAVKVGIAWPWQIVKKIPTEEHDVKMDFVVTPERYFAATLET